VIVSVSPDAERELIDAAIFYAEQESAELGLAFIVEFERALDVLREHPNFGAPWRDTTRRFQLRRFPYPATGRPANSRTSPTVVIPAEAGIHCFSVNMDPRLRGDDASVTNRGDVISVTNRCDVTSVTNRRDVTASSVFSPPWRRPLQRIS
jgi:plasmid stabilization system protein ParE